MNSHDDGAKPPKRTDVGYGRPPEEHRFKKGQPRPARKEKPKAAGPVPFSEIMRKVLDEPRRVVINNKTKWVTGGELVMRQGYLLAEKGSAMLARELAQLLLSGEARGPDAGFYVRTAPGGSPDETGLRVSADDRRDG